MSESWYARHILPYAVDLACGMKVARRLRHQIVPSARGRVLEIGVGTGLNLAHYDKAKLSRLVALDPAPAMHRLARKRSARAELEVELVGVSAERIPLEDASFDSVVVTWSLCSISDPIAALREMRRVLAPGGRLLFCEHGRAPEAGVRRWQERLTPYWKRIAGGCHLDRDVPGLLREAGFARLEMQEGYLPGPRALTYNYWGEAVAR